MIPDKSDPIWRSLVTGKMSYEFKSIPGEMLITRLVSKCKTDSSDETIRKATEEAHAFFEKYQAILRGDIIHLFGQKKEFCQ